jgi:hypothetical protein
VNQIDALLADPYDRILVCPDGSALLVDWYTWDLQPQSIVEMKFGTGWETVECDVQAFRCSVGRDLTFEQVEAGRAEISLDNRNGDFTNFVNGHPPIDESTEVRLRLRHPTKDPAITHGERVVWWGQVSNWQQEWTAATDVVVVEAVDLIASLNEQGGALGWRSGTFGDSVPNRLQHLIARVGLGLIHTYFEQGQVQLVDPKLRSETVLDAAHNIALSDGGHFFSEVDHLNQRSVVYLNRSRFGGPPGMIGGRTTPDTPQPTLMRNVPAERTADLGLGRPAQGDIPLFSDRCGQGAEGYPYTDLVWAYRGWEMPSIVAVSNMEAPQEYDQNGDELPPAWPEVGHIALAQGRRHNIIEYTGLEFYKQADATALGELYAHVLSRARFDVTVLEVHPETDERLWDVVASLRQGDWVKIERNLKTDRIVATCAIEGIEFALVADMPHKPRWKVTYRLSSMSVTTNDIPVVELPPRPPGTIRPPLTPIPVITLAAIGAEAVAGLGQSTFVERGTPYNVFELSILDTARPVSHKAFAFSDEFGLVELPNIIPRTYSGDGVRRQFGGVGLGPGVWYVYVTDGSRRSNQIAVDVPAWDDIILNDPDLHWVPDGESSATYLDDRYPAWKPRVFVRSNEGDIEVPVVDWQPVGDPATTKQFTVRFDTSKLPPNDYKVWIQDSVVARRRSAIYERIILPRVPGRPTLAPFDALDWDKDAWNKIGIRWDPVPGVPRYRVQYREVGETAWRSTTEEQPFHLLDGGDANSNGQREKLWEVMVAAEWNGQQSEWTTPVIFETGYPYVIITSDYSVAGLGGTVSLNDVFGVTIPQPYCPPWAQSVDPDADFPDGSTSFVGIECSKIEFFNMRSFLKLFGWDRNTGYPEGSIVSAADDAPGFLAVFRANEPIAPRGKEPNESGSGWRKLTRFYDTPVGAPWFEATSLRWYPEDDANQQVWLVAHTLQQSVNDGGGATGPNENVSFSMELVSGRDVGQSPNYGLAFVGGWWGNAPANTIPPFGAYASYSHCVATGKQNTYYPPKRPRRL